MTNPIDYSQFAGFDEAVFKPSRWAGGFTSFHVDNNSPEAKLIKNAPALLSRCQELEAEVARLTEELRRIKASPWRGILR